MLIVLAEEHQANFQRLISGAIALAASHNAGEVASRAQENLLKFYAVEVGLKYLLNSVEKIPFKHETGGQSAYIEKYSHKLDDMVIALKVPASRIPPLVKSQFQCIPGYNVGGAGQTFSLHAAHEAWRYGLTIDPADEAEIVSYLNGVATYISEEI